MTSIINQIGGLGNSNDPDFISPNVGEQQAELEVVRAIQSGFPSYTKLLHPQFKEDQEQFNHRQQWPILFDELTPNIRDLTGKLLNTDPDVTCSAAITNLLENVDNRGTALVPFLQELFSDAIWAGHALVLVDYVTVPGVATVADEVAAGARPYWVHIQKDQVRNFGTTVVNGVTVLSWVSILENALSPDGFGYSEKPQVRVLRRTPDGATWQLYQKNKRGKWGAVDQGAFISSAGKPVPEIPLIPFYTRPDGILCSRPFGIELARNVQMAYNIASDMLHNHSVSSYPTPTFIGNIQKEKLAKTKVGGLNAIVLPDGSKFEYVAANVAGVDMAVKLLDQLARESVVLGTRLFETNKPDRETATAKILDNTMDDNISVQLAGRLEDQLELVLGITQYYLTGAPGDNEVTLAPNKEPEPPATPEGSPKQTPALDQFGNEENTG